MFFSGSKEWMHSMQQDTGINLALSLGTHSQIYKHMQQNKYQQYQNITQMHPSKYCTDALNRYCTYVMHENIAQMPYLQSFIEQACKDINMPKNDTHKDTWTNFLWPTLLNSAFF